MAVPQEYRTIDGSECRPSSETRRVGPEQADKPLSATIRVKQAAGPAGRDRVAEYAVAQGLRLDLASETDEIIVSGTIAQINSAFGIELKVYMWRGENYRGYEGFASLPAEIAELVAEVIGLIDCETEGQGPWSGAGKPSGGSTRDVKGPIRVVADWVVPHPGPSGPVTPANYAIVSSFDIDWVNTAGFQTLLDNMAASPGAFGTVRVMKALNSGSAEIGGTVTGLPPAPDTVWPYAAAPAPPPPIDFSTTISALTEITKRGLTPFVVLGFFPQGVYNGTTGGVPSAAVTGFSGESPPYGPSASYMQANPGDWKIILQNWNTLIQEFFNTLNTTFGTAIQSWWFEIWNEPDNPFFWLPDAQANNESGVPPSNQTTLYYYLQLYQETVAAIGAITPRLTVQVGGPAIMANTLQLDVGDSGAAWSAGSQTDLQIALPLFLDFVYNPGTTAAPSPSLQCDFISLHAKGDWTEYQLPNLTQAPPTGVIYTVESAVSQFTSQAKYEGYFNNISIINDEADMRVGAGVPFYPRMTSQFPAWLTALMIANDSLTSEYASKGGAQFMGGSDNAHLELVGWQTDPDGDSGSVSGASAFGQQRSIMTAASPWSAGSVSAPALPQDLVKTPVYNFYELLRLLGDQHGVFISGQNNFYPTDSTSGWFSMITLGAPSGQLTHVCWVFCVYPTDPKDLPTTGKPQTPTGWTTTVEVIDLPASWSASGVNWVQFQIGPDAASVPDVNSFTVAQNGQPEATPVVPTAPAPGTGGVWEYEMPTPPTQVSLSNPGFNASNIRMSQELGLVQYMPNVPLSGGAWKSPAPIDFEPYSSVAFWITPYDATQPAAPVASSYALPGGTVDPVPVAVQVGANVVLRWRYPASDPIYASFFYFEVSRGDKVITPTPTQTKDGVLARSFALRAAMWIDTAPGAGTYTYSIRAVSASNVKSAPLTFSLTVT